MNHRSRKIIETLIAPCMFTFTLGSCGNRVVTLNTPELNQQAPESPVAAGSKQKESLARDDSKPTNSLSSASKYHFFAFSKPAPNDPQQKRDFAIDQTMKIANKVQSLTKHSFQSKVLIDPTSITLGTLKEELLRYKSTLQPNDTFVMYSHTHGIPEGLVIDFQAGRENAAFKWKELAQAILDLPARNVVVFTMACHSGSLTQAIEQLSGQWKNRRLNEKRNLIVLSAVSSEQLANATDFETKDDAIGNPFTYGVRTAIGGQADGYGGHPKDSKLTMSELVHYILDTTKTSSLNQYAKPQFAGEYADNEILFDLSGKNSEKIEGDRFENEVNGIVSLHLGSDGGKVPGVVVGIVNGQSNKVYGFGEHSRGSQVKPDANTIFEIGSITKTFTGLMLAQNVVLQKMQLNDTMSRYLPPEVSSPRFRDGTEIELKHLATHTSGLPNLPDNLTPIRDQMPTVGYTENMLINYLKVARLAHKPGSNAEYSNLGMGLLGYILMQFEKSDYESLLKNKITDPCAMPDTKIKVDDSELYRLAVGDFEGRTMPASGETILAGTGSIRSTGKDMLRFLEVLLGTYKCGLNSAVDLSQRSHFSSGNILQGLGIGLSQLNGPVFKKDGYTRGFGSYILFSREQKLGVVVLANSSKQGVAAEIAGKVLEVLRMNQTGSAQNSSSR